MTLAERDPRAAAARLGELLLARGWTLALAESCTGGLIGHTLTEVPGASAWLNGGVVAYANSAKTALLGVPAAVIDAHGAVSRETVEAMARGASQAFGADCAVAVSGIAGPTGGSPDKPVGTVWIACLVPGELRAERLQLHGGRARIKSASALGAIDALARLVEAAPGPNPA